MEKDLVKLFSAGLMTIGSAGFSLPIPRGAITKSPELLNMISAKGKIAPLKPIILNLAANLKKQISAHGQNADLIQHHATTIPLILERHPPATHEVRTAIDAFSSSRHDPSINNNQPIEIIVAKIIAEATAAGLLVKHSVGAALIGEILHTLLTDLIAHQNNLIMLRPIFIEYHSKAQIKHGINALKRGSETHRTTPLWSAVEAFELAQQIQAEDMVPENWAKLQNDKGAAIGMIAERSRDPIKLRQAMDMLSTAADIWNRERDPLKWAETETNLGNAGWLLGLMENKPELLRSSFRRLEAAHAVYADEGFDQQAKVIHKNLERMLTMIRLERQSA